MNNLICLWMLIKWTYEMINWTRKTNKYLNLLHPGTKSRTRSNWSIWELIWNIETKYYKRQRLPSQAFWHCPETSIPALPLIDKRTGFWSHVLIASDTIFESGDPIPNWMPWKHAWSRSSREDTHVQESRQSNTGSFRHQWQKKNR